MDQLKAFGGWLKRHHFWVLTALLVIVAVVCWMRGANALHASYLTSKSMIEAEFKIQQDLKSQAFHANEDINKRQETEIAAQRKSTQELWAQLSKRQQDDVLKWPTNLSKQFREYIEKLKFGDHIPSDLRDHYNNYIGEHFPELPKIVSARKMSSTEGGGARSPYEGRGMGEGRARAMPRGEAMPGRDPNQPVEEEEEYIVEWLDQGRVRDELFSPSTPTSKRIWKTQEDLWVYEALLGIIARTNQAKGADRYSNAAVREIDMLEVGQLAAAASRTHGRIDMLAPQQTGGGEGAPMGERGGEMASRMPMGEGMGAPMGEGRGGMPGEAPTDDSLLIGRYVDKDGKPTTAPEGDTETKEFKRLPIRMQLVMDQRWLPHLLSECANAPLQVEVQEVRINPSEAGAMGGMGGRGGYSSFSSTTPGEAITPDPEPDIKPVIIQGIIYIFNPPSATTEETTSSQVANAH